MMLFHKINGNKDIITNVLTEIPRILKVNKNLLIQVETMQPEFYIRFH